MIKRIPYACLAALLVILTMAGCGKDAKEPSLAEDKAGLFSGDEKINLILTRGEDEGVLFYLGDLKAYTWEAKLYLYNMQESYESIYGNGFWQHTGTDGLDPGEHLKSSAMARITAVKTMVLLAQSRGIELETKEKQLAAQAAQTYYGSLPSDVKNDLGADAEDIADAYLNLALADKVYHEILMETEPEISDDEARIVTVSRILIKTKKPDGNGNEVPFSDSEKREAYQKALAILSRLKQGEDFDTLAAANNEGGKITVSFGKDEVSPEVSEAAFSLGSEEISRVVETEDGYLIMKCLQPFDKKQTDLRKDRIAAKRKEEAFASVYDDFSKGLFRHLVEDEYKKLRLSSGTGSGGENFFSVYMSLFTQNA